jgi:hypothetical protein
VTQEPSAIGPHLTPSLRLAGKDYNYFGHPDYPADLAWTSGARRGSGASINAHRRIPIFGAAKNKV